MRPGTTNLYKSVHSFTVACDSTFKQLGVTPPDLPLDRAPGLEDLNWMDKVENFSQLAGSLSSVDPGWWSIDRMLNDPKMKDQLLDCVFLCPDKYPDKESFISAAFEYAVRDPNVVPNDPYLEFHLSPSVKRKIVKTYFLNVLTNLLEGLNISKLEIAERATQSGSKI